MALNDWVKIGRIVNTHGIRGEVKIAPLTDDPERFLKLDTVTVQTLRHTTQYTIKQVRFHKNHLLVTFEGVDTADQAQLLKNAFVLIDKTDRLPLDENSFYIDDLIGLEVFDANGTLGTIREVLQPGANDVYVVESEQGDIVYVPALKSVVTQVDIAAGRMDVILPAGLLD